MNLLLPYFIILIVVFQFFLRKNSKKNVNSNKEFWDREHQANNTRKQNIDNLDYITIPETLPIPESLDSDIIKLKNDLLALKDKKILNLTGMSNTDLKMEYGVANLTALTEYDNNYSDLVRKIAAGGDLLFKKGYEKEAVELLELGIQYRTDITRNYTTLAEYYVSHNMNNKIDQLLMTAETLNSLSKDVIIKKLGEIKG